MAISWFAWHQSFLDAAIPCAAKHVAEVLDELLIHDAAHADAHRVGLALQVDEGNLPEFESLEVARTICQVARHARQALDDHCLKCAILVGGRSHESLEAVPRQRAAA